MARHDQARNAGVRRDTLDETLPKFFRRVYNIRSYVMKAFRSIILALLSIGFLTSCEKEDHYYVKYDVNVVLHEGEEIDINYILEDGKRMNYHTTSDNPFSVTIGPVTKGFIAGVTASIFNCTTNEVSGLYCWISVSQNNGPFTMVEQDGGAFCVSTKWLYHTVGQ